ncbi:phage portal protein [Shinella sp. S4-D37]|uniref:phage portal protein n=1 Tax=Shinella sp. S4-D37 TaxID=3161999 RepID=UPI0034671A18
MVLPMLNRLRSFFTGKRSYTGAAGGRRWSGAQSMPAPVSSAHAARHTLAARARFAVANNPLACSGLESWVTSLVGTGVKMQSRHADTSIRETLSARFEAWTDSADADEATDFYGIQASAVRSMIVAGEAFILMLNTASGLRLRLLDPEQVDSSYTVALSDGGQVVQGVEMDAEGKRRAYHVFVDRPGHMTGFTRQRSRIPSDDICHLYRPLWPGQIRGISFFAPVLLRMADHEGSRDSQQVRQRVGAALAGFIRSTDASGPPMDGEQAGNTLVGGLEPGTLKYLAPGEEIVFSSPPTIGMDAIAFMRLTEKEIAVGLGVPAYLLNGDLSDVNYSSIRAGLISFRERVEALQHSVLVFQFLRRVYERWVTLEVLDGKVSTTIDAALPAIWVTPRQAWVDPLKDAEAEILLFNNGMKSRREIVASRGLDIEALDAEMAADKARADGLGLTFGTPPANDNTPPAAIAA